MSPSNRPSDQDEFDVEELAGKLFRVSRKGIIWITKPVTSLVNDWVKLLVSLALGALVAMVMYWTFTPLYKSKFTLKPANRGDLFYFTLIGDLSEAVAKGESQAAAQLLHCSPEIIYDLAGIDLKTVWVNGEKRDSAINIIIELIVIDPSRLDTLQHLVKNYLETNEYYARIRQTRADAITLTLAQLQQDRNEIDSIKRLAVNNMMPRGNGGLVYGEPINPVRLYEDALNLYRQEISYKAQLQYLDNFELISGCLPVSKPYSPNLKKLMAISLGGGFIVAMIWSRLTRKRRKPGIYSEFK